MSKFEEKSRAFPGGVGQWQKMKNGKFRRGHDKVD